MQVTYEPEFWVPTNATGKVATLIYDFGNDQHENIITINFYWTAVTLSVGNRSEDNELKIQMSNFVQEFKPTRNDELQIEMHFQRQGESFIQIQNPKWIKGNRWKWPQKS